MGAQDSLPARKRTVAAHPDIAYGPLSSYRRKICHLRPNATTHAGTELERPTTSALDRCHTIEQQFQ